MIQFMQKLNFRFPALVGLLAIFLQFPSSSGSLFTDEVSTVPYGYVDSVASGAEKAEDDLASGKPLYGIAGLASGRFVSKLKLYGVTPVFLGCVVHDRGIAFWEGYNQYVKFHITKLGEPS